MYFPQFQFDGAFFFFRSPEKPVLASFSAQVTAAYQRNVITQGRFRPSWMAINGRHIGYLKSSPVSLVKPADCCRKAARADQVATIV
jgi:hypothetical protein